MARMRTTPKASSGTPASAGFTLLELLVSMVLMVLALTLAAQLLLESQRTFALSGRAALEPMASYAYARLTSDVQSASGAQSATDGALLLTGHPEGTLRWERRGEELWRTAFADDGRIRSRRVMLQRVETWIWSWDGSLVTAIFAYRRGAMLRYVTTPSLPPEVIREERVVVQAHPRGQPRWNQW